MSWTPEEERLLKSLIKKDVKQIEKEFKKRFDKKLPGFRKYRSEKAITKRHTLLKDKDQSPDPYNLRWEKIKAMNKEHKMLTEKNSVGLNVKPEVKILCLSDIHFPFALEDEIMAALKEHSDADIVVFNGDILDGYIYSTFAKAKRIAALKEYIAAFELIRYCSENFPKVAIVSGNHDVRPARHLQRVGFEKEESQVLRPDLLARIANGERLNEEADLVEKLDFDNVYYQKYDSWYIRIGKTLFCHPLVTEVDREELLKNYMNISLKEWVLMNLIL